MLNYYLINAENMLKFVCENRNYIFFSGFFDGKKVKKNRIYLNVYKCVYCLF